jgi:hypothetical protein
LTCSGWLCSFRLMPNRSGASLNVTWPSTIPSVPLILKLYDATAYLQPVNMTRSTEDSARHGSPRLEDRVHQFLNSSLPIRDLRRQAGSLLACEGLLEIILALTREDQAKFVDKTDQVRRSSWLPIVLSQRTFVRKGVPDPRRTKCQVFDRSWRNLQRHRPPPTLGRNHRRTQGRWQRCCRVRKAH